LTSLPASRVIQGKVETVKLPPPYDDPSVRVDVIISEWMGYALLYESMLDSVLVARDRFLNRPTSSDGTGGGIMAPSQCKMVFALAEATEVWKDRVAFWEDVYGGFYLHRFCRSSDGTSVRIQYVFNG
jgi:protein arginine N-methyltransferase 3